ncbi:MAG: PilN domain-containing protein [Armatimonadetes bacterium]|nr:PilN domain-containing protein [Armatimonadota bacterium]
MRAHANFIGNREEQRRRETRIAGWALALAVAFGLAPLLLVGLIRQGAAERATLLKDINKRRETVLNNLVGSAWMEAENKRLEPGHKVVVAAHTNLAKWTELLNEVRDRLPEGAWLTQVSIARADFDAAKPLVPGTSPQTVIVVGTAAKAEAVGAYLEQLNRSPLLARAVLVRSHPSEAKLATATAPAVDYELRAEVKQPIAEGQP